jgi:hypothetical protein
VEVSRVVAMRESSEEDLGVREVAGFVMTEGVRSVEVQGMDLKKSYEEEDGSAMLGLVTEMGVEVFGKSLMLKDEGIQVFVGRCSW